MPSRLLVLSVSAGAGHTRAAEAIKATALQSPPDRAVIVTHVDVLTLVSASFRALYGDFYLRLVERHPALWSYLFHVTDRTPRDAPFSKVRRAIERLNTRKLRECLDDVKPDHIVCTHFLPAEVLAHEIGRGRVKAPVWVVVTDFDVHRLWLQPHMRGYFAASDEVAFRLRARGIEATSIAVTGIPVMPVFESSIDRAEAARSVGLDSTKPTLLLTSGGAGVGGGAPMLERLLAIRDDLQVIALAGKNRRLLEGYRHVATRVGPRVRPIGFSDEMERLMAASDVVVTKPGGLTVSECIAMQVPMVVISPIPGQEERNADFLLEHGLAVKALDPDALEYRVRRLFADPQRLSSMRAHLAAARRPHAAAGVLAHVLGHA